MTSIRMESKLLDIGSGKQMWIFDNDLNKIMSCYKRFISLKFIKKNEEETREIYDNPFKSMIPSEIVT